MSPLTAAADLSDPEQPSESRITYEEFLDRAEDGTHAEWVDGEILIMSPTSKAHQDLADFLAALLRLYSEARQPGTVISAPFQMKVGPDLPGREPDVLFVAEERLDAIKESYLDGPADLAVEVISRDSRARDRGDKFYEYEQGGVREYWLIDRLRRQAEFYRLGDDGIFHTVPIGDDGIFRSEVLDGLWLRVDWPWRQPLPALLSVLKDWRLI